MSFMSKRHYKGKYYKQKTLSIPRLLIVIAVAIVIVLTLVAIGKSLMGQTEDQMSSDPLGNLSSSSEQTSSLSEQNQTQQDNTSLENVEQPTVDESEPEPPALTPEEQKYQEVKQLAEKNCDNTQPIVTDPALWQENANEILGKLEDDPYYQDFGIDLNYVESYPYLLAVNRAASTVTVYAVDDNHRYTVPYMAMVCSGGEDTPLGYYQTPVNYQWRLLSGPCYGQYATRIWDAYLFHSVPYYTQHKDDLEYIEYNKLGTLASLGCIRLQTVDVKWIFDHCPIGTKVIIYDDEEIPGPMGKPGTIYIDPENEALRGWDPTDPDPANPWDEQYRTGTAIRSDEAWKQYNEEWANDTFVSTINPADLQGWNHDYTTEGTRG